MKCPHPAGRRWSSGWEKLSLDQEDLALGRCERRSLAGLEAARSQGQLSGPSWGAGRELGRIECSQSGSGVGGERLLFRLYLLDCPGLLAPLTNVHIPRVSFLLLDVRAAGGSPAEGRGRRGSGAGLGSAGSRRSRCPEGSGLSSGQGCRPCSSLVRFVCLWPNLSFPSASVPPTPRSAARTLGDPPAFADTCGSGALVPYLSRAPSPAPWIPQPAPRRARGRISPSGVKRMALGGVAKCWCFHQLREFDLGTAEAREVTADLSGVPGHARSEGSWPEEARLSWPARMKAFRSAVASGPPSPA